MNENIAQQDKSQLTRRDFLKRMVALTTMAFFPMALDQVSRLRLARLVNKLYGATEVLGSQIRSQQDSFGELVILNQRETLISEPNFTVEMLTTTAPEDNQIIRCTLVSFESNSKFQLVPVPSGKRESLLDYASNSPFAIGPIGYVDGIYHRDNSNSSSDKLNVSLRYPGGIFGETNRSDLLTDRFPGLDEDINNTSGGLYFDHDKLVIADKKNLTQAIRNGNGFLQMVYYIDQTNQASILSQQWEHFGRAIEIGNTVYYWGGYVDFTQNGKSRKGYLVFDQEMGSLNHFVGIVKKLSDDGNFKIALADPGNGSSILVQSSQLPGGDDAYGINKFITHLVPYAILIK